MIEIILVIIFALAVVAGLAIAINEFGMLESLPRIRAVKKAKEVEEPEPESALSRRIAAESHRKKREAEEKAAEKRLEENHKRRQDELLEFDYRMEALLPHSEHAKKNRLSPRTGCYDCEQQRQADLNQWRWMIERI